MPVFAAWVPLFLEFLMSTALKGVVALLLVWGLVGLMGRASASARHLAWSLAFCGILAMMAAFTILPHWRVDLLPALDLPKSTVPAPPANPAAPGEKAAPPAVASTAVAADTTDSLRTWRMLVFWTWLAGFAILYLRFLAGIVKVWMWSRRAGPPRGSLWEPLLASLQARFALKRPVRVLMTDRHITPMTWGVRRPVVLLPREAADWSRERLEMVLTHEMAHIVRSDFLLLNLTHFLCAFYWFNPLIWLAMRKLVREREHACDDRVLRDGVRASTYADHLLEIARSLKASGALELSSLSMAHVSELEGRLYSLLDEERSHHGLARSSLLAAIPLYALILVPLALLTPWREAPLLYPLQQDWEQVPAGLAFPPAERRRLARADISPEYVAGLLAVGYKNPTVDQIISLKLMGIDPNTLAATRNQPPERLTELVYKGYVCMYVDAVLDEPTLAINIDGRTYYGFPRCTAKLVQNEAARYAHDPLTDKKVNKAEAVIGVSADRRVSYFESSENLHRFNEMRGFR